MNKEPIEEESIDESLEEKVDKATTEKEEKDVEDNKFWALLSYLGVLVVILLLIKRESPFCQFHIRQGLVLLVGWVVSWFPIFGWIVGIIVFVLSIMGIINVINGERKKLPLIGEVAEKIVL